MSKFLPACSKAFEPLPDPKHAQIPRSYIQHNKWIFHSKYCCVRAGVSTQLTSNDLPLCVSAARARLSIRGGAGEQEFHWAPAVLSIRN